VAFTSNDNIHHARIIIDSAVTAGMISGMTMSKIAISLPEAVLRQARIALKRGHAASMSSYIASALQQRAMSDDLSDMIADMLSETGGRLTREEQAEADRLLGVSRDKARTKPRTRKTRIRAVAKRSTRGKRAA
jgi:hypothetical protein